MPSRRTAVKALGEVALRVNDLKRMKQFYEETLGLELMGDFDTSAFFKIAEVHAGHTQVLVLFDRSQGPRDSRISTPTPEGVSQQRSTLDHLALSIDLGDFAAEKARLESLALKVDTADHHWVKWKSLYVRDPEGNIVEFVCFDADM